MRRTARKAVLYAFLGLTAFAALFPTAYTALNSLMNEVEILRYYAAPQMTLHLIPDQFSLESYYQILLRRPDYLIKFWYSMGMTLSIVLCQVFLAFTAGYAFAKFRFPGRNALFFLVIIMMMMPLQVTLVTNYIVLKRMNLVGSWWAVLLSAIFSPFGVFLMRQSIATTPDDLIDAAKLDGARQKTILARIILPRNRSALAALIVLAFIDAWNMVEQPIVLLQSEQQYPLSVFLAQMNRHEPGTAFACGVLALVPVFLMFLLFEEELVDGVAFMTMK